MAGGARRPSIAGVEVVEVVGDGDDAARSGLVGALELIAGGAAGVLVVVRLHDAASSLGELVALLAWLEQTGADLIAVDVGFDSGEASARGTIALLREVERWDRDPHPAGRPRGGAEWRPSSVQAALGYRRPRRPAPGGPPLPPPRP